MHGIPEQMMSDNGPQFVSADFEKFLRNNGFKDPWSSLYHPASNSEAEMFVRTFKEAMKTVKGDGLTLAHHLENIVSLHTPSQTLHHVNCR